MLISSRKFGYGMSFQARKDLGGGDTGIDLVALTIRRRLLGNTM
jgi:hypothetical protein